MNENTEVGMDVIHCQSHSAMEAGDGGRTFEGGTGVRSNMVRMWPAVSRCDLGGSPLLSGFGAIVVS